ncbi:hypothetical protein LCM20_09365 [Halobacillus litoralis]|uniref:hypothetical protein n=1 Tax=Halobacillus litoralis TaxID=45668 RepID=UPI001CD2B80D|nr:hypothetical protein [Halobacillus litoralis]MCA0970797.1 hypothetical protein [Halobacillus litoralis]
MSKKAFHIYNITALLILSAFNLLVLFAFGMGEGGMGISAWLPITLSFVIWGGLYFVQFVRSNEIWRMSWFFVMVVSLFFWQTGLGASFGRMFG